MSDHNTAYVRVMSYVDGRSPTIRWAFTVNEIWSGKYAQVPMPEWVQERLAVLMTMVPDDPWSNISFSNGEYIDTYGPPDTNSSVSVRLWFKLMKQPEGKCTS